MEISVIDFEVRNFSTGEAERFVVENTADNYSLIATQKNTRDIQVKDMFDFQFERERHEPKFITFTEIVMNAFDNYDESDDVDEMHGTY